MSCGTGLFCARWRYAIIVSLIYAVVSLLVFFTFRNNCLVRPEAPGECFWTWFILLYWMLTIALGYLFFFICKSPLETGL
ncbi:MAG TPA: hypothetical protein PLI07_10985, partial [Candidatus Hydrogenedentes bacterium]|nr:hypothetical protein [Candidatus Hydrogenedentota bacterium]